MHKPSPTSENIRRMLLPFHKEHEDTDLSPHTQTEWRSTVFYTHQLNLDPELPLARMEEIQPHLSSGSLYFLRCLWHLTGYEGDMEFLS